MRAVPIFVPEISREAMGPQVELECILLNLKRLETHLLGAGRGNRTPMELLPTDFESAASASSAIPAPVLAPTTASHRAVSIAARCGQHRNHAIVSLA